MDRSSQVGFGLATPTQLAIPGQSTRPELKRLDECIGDYLGQMHGYSATQIGMVIIWLGLPQLVSSLP
jgi:hypothetical protein